MNEYVFRDAPDYGCDMDEYWEEVGMTVGEYYASNNDDHYGTLHEEIVRCKDCAYTVRRKYNNGFEYLNCSYFNSEYAEVEPDGFCKWGERKEGGDD